LKYWVYFPKQTPRLCLLWAKPVRNRDAEWLIFCDGYFLYFSQYLAYWTDLHQIFRICTHMSEHDQSGLILASAQGTLLW